MKLKKFITTLTIVAVLFSGIQITRLILAVKKSGADQAKLAARTKGPAKAEFRIEEYTDFQCPACAAGARTLKQYAEKFPDQIQVVFHYFPLASHKQSQKIAVAAECSSRQGEFWDYQDLAFERQKALHKTMRIEGRLTDMARELQLDIPSFEKCLRDPVVELGVIADKKDGVLRGVQATPTYFVNDEMVVGSKKLLEYLQKNLGAVHE